MFFATVVLKSQLWQAQIDLLNAVRDSPLVAFRSCHGPGKTYGVARVALWRLFCFPRSIVLSTAPTWRQVEKLLWKEIRSAVRQSPYRLPGHLLPKSPEYQLIQDEWYAAGLSTNDPDKFQGEHERHITIIADEASGIPDDIFEAVDGIMTSEDPKQVLIGNPTKIGGRFHRAFQKEKGWKTIHVSAYDTPNFTRFGITERDIIDDTWQRKITGPFPYPNLVMPAWARYMYEKWGRESPVYEARVLGNFPTQGDRAVIPLAYIEASMAAWEDARAGEPIELGCDIAAEGDDRNAVAVAAGRKVIHLETWSEPNTMRTAERIRDIFERFGGSLIKIDKIGIGKGVFDKLSDFDLPVCGVNVALPAIDRRHYFNRKTELWWTLREDLDPNPRKDNDPAFIPDNDELRADLSAPIYFPTNKGQVRMEKKEETKKRLKRSPDLGDAVVLALAEGFNPEDEVYEPVSLEGRSIVPRFS